MLKRFDRGNFMKKVKARKHFSNKGNSNNGGNWPSKTGNPSGGGRGNGPSRSK